MAVDERSRHALHTKLQKVLGEEEAVTMMELVPPVGWGEVATKRDLDDLRSDFRDLKSDFRELRRHMDRPVSHHSFFLYNRHDRTRRARFRSSPARLIVVEYALQ